MSITSTIIMLKSAEEQEWKDLYNYIIKLEQENRKHKNWVDILNKENHKLNSIIKEVRDYINNTIDIKDVKEIFEHFNRIEEILNKENSNG